MLTILNYYAAFMGAWIIFGLILFNVYAVVARYFFNAPVPGSTEISTYLIPVIAFLGLAYGLEVGSHIVVDIFVERLKKRTQLILNIIMTIFIIILGAILSWKGMEVSIEKFHERSSSELMLPLFIFYIWVPVGSLLLFLQAIRNIKGYVLSLKREKLGDESDISVTAH